MNTTKQAERFAVKLTHLAAGWRFWAFERSTGEDETVGLSGDGYGTEEAARAAIRRVERDGVQPDYYDMLANDAECTS